MVEYFSMLSKEDMKDMKRSEILKTIGVKINNEVVSPALCTECGSFCTINHLDEDYLNCSNKSCRKITKKYVYKDTFFKKNED